MSQKLLSERLSCFHRKEGEAVSDLFKKFRTCDVHIDELWRIALPEDVVPPEGNLVVIPSSQGSLAVVREAEVGAFTQALFDELFGDFNHINRRHLLLRSWLFEHVCECRPSEFGLTVTTGAIGGFRNHGGRVRLLVQSSSLGPANEPIAYGSSWTLLDGKGGLFLPERLTRFLGSNPIAFPALTGDSIWLVPDIINLRDLVDVALDSKFGNESRGSRNREMLKMALLDKAAPSCFERGNHLRIPRNIIQETFSDGDVVVIGVADHVELHPATPWAESSAQAGLLWQL